MLVGHKRLDEAGRSQIQGRARQLGAGAGPRCTRLETSELDVGIALLIMVVACGGPMCLHVVVGGPLAKSLTYSSVGVAECECIWLDHLSVSDGSRTKQG